MTNKHARILAAMMPTEVVDVLVNFGKTDMDNIAGATIDYLKEFKLIERVMALDGKTRVWVKTEDGKKVLKYLQ